MNNCFGDDWIDIELERQADELLEPKGEKIENINGNGNKK